MKAATKKIREAEHQRLARFRRTGCITEDQNAAGECSSHSARRDDGPSRPCPSPDCRKPNENEQKRRGLAGRETDLRGDHLQTDRRPGDNGRPDVG